MGIEVSVRTAPAEAVDEVRRRALARVLASRHFRQTSRLSALLQYVAEKAMAGKPEEATEQPIGVQVFGRQPGFNPAEDNIVRSTARQLRERLALYYQEDGRDDELRIVMAPGSYLPRFEPREPAPLAAPPPAAPPAEPAARLSPGWLAAPVLLALGLAVAFAVAPGRPAPPNQLWSQLFAGTGPVILVSGDSGVVMRQNLTGSVVHVKDYLSRNFALAPAVPPRLDAATVNDLGERRYTSYSDLRFAVRLAGLPGLPRDRLTLRYARDLRVEELKKGSHVILVGAPQGNPWVELFDKDLNFRIESDEARRTLTVLNRQPRAGEQAAYTYRVTDDNRRAYALISLTRNLDDTGSVLLVQGTTVAGIEAATDFLFHDHALDAILRPAQGARGFTLEVLLETAFLDGSGGRAEVRAQRLTPRD